MNIAFVHDWLATFTGAERTLEAILDCYPDAPVYTLIYRPEIFKESSIKDHPIFPSALEKMPGGRSHYRTYLPLMPFIIEQLDLSKYDAIVSSSHAVAKGILTREDQVHISYIYTPIRYAWDLQAIYLKEAGLERGIRSFITRAILHYIRLWDYGSAQRPDFLAAISNYVARRVYKTYRRHARVIYPPVEVERFSLPGERQEFYLTTSRFVPYKRIDLVVEAFNELGLPLVVIGSGPDWEKIKKISAKTVQLLGQQPDDVVVDYMQRCKAFVYAADEDFGIASVEAQAAGAPVIAYGHGGSTETIISGKTGLFFDEQTTMSLMEAVRYFESGEIKFDPRIIRKNAERFNKGRFQSEFQSFIHESLDGFFQNRQ